MTLIDATLWVDFTRTKTPEAIKRFIAPFILDPAAHLAEPVEFEILRFATEVEKRQLARQFETFPQLRTPPKIWTDAAELGQVCRKAGFVAGAMDLLIAGVAIYHYCELVTLDGDFLKIAEVSELRVKLLRRP
jgi:predicted nucleic acid-binding protein